MTKLQIVRGLPGKFGGMEDLEKEPPVEWLIKDYLASNELTVMYGKGGSFKSYIALGWTLQLACIKVPSVYIAAEGTSGLRARVDAWMASHRLGGSYLDNWHYYNANVHIDDDEVLGVWMEGMRTYLKDRPEVKLIVVDTLARNFTGDESSPKEMGMFIEGCERLRREFGAAILVIHHMGVATGRERGSEALRNATFAMYKVSNAQHNDRGGGSVLLECDRMKDAPMPDEVRIYFDTVALNVDQYGEVMAMSQAMRKFPPRKGERPKQTVIDATEET